MDNSYEELLNTISELQKENASFRAWQTEMNKIVGQMMNIIEQQKSDAQKTQQYAFINRIRLESLPYEIDDSYRKSSVFVPQFISVNETRRLLIEEGKSIGRFGDGEFGIISGVARWNFQSTNPVLAEKLKTVLESKDNGFIVGLNRNFYGNLDHLSEVDADGVRAYMRPAVRKLHAKLLHPDRVYGDAGINNINCDDDTCMLKKLWNQKECVFIEGQHTCMGVGNDLFDNCASIERIICPAENAIDKYDEIMDETLKQPKGKLILLALGPTATALAYDLFKEGYQAVDIGHIDLVYEKFIRKLDNLEDVSIPFKYCNWDEVGERRQIPEADDEAYKSQIIASIV